MEPTVITPPSRREARETHRSYWAELEFFERANGRTHPSHLRPDPAEHGKRCGCLPCRGFVGIMSTVVAA